MSWINDPKFNCYVDRYGYTACNKCDYKECNEDDEKRAEVQDEVARRYNSN